MKAALESNKMPVPFKVELLIPHHQIDLYIDTRFPSGSAKEGTSPLEPSASRDP